MTNVVIPKKGTKVLCGKAFVGSHKIPDPATFSRIPPRKARIPPRLS